LASFGCKQNNSQNHGLPNLWQDIELDWSAFKICQTKDLVSHDFGYYLVGYQNLPTSHIWLAKSMVTFLPNFGMANLGCKRPIFWKPSNQALILCNKESICSDGLASAWIL